MTNYWKLTHRVVSWAAVSIVALVAIAACSEVIGGGQARMATITFRTAPAAQFSRQADASLAASIPVAGGGHTVDVQSVDLLFDDVKLERVRTADERDSDSEDSEDSDEGNDHAFEVGALTVALPVGNGSVTPFSQELPLGTYSEIQMKARYARIRGTYDGLPFDVTVPVDVRIENDLDPPFVVATSADRPNVTVNVDVLSWFRNPDGTVIDPRRLSVDRSLRETFAKRVRASFRAFEDSDKDGDERDSDSDR